jgi:hypothetical protein
MKNQKRRNYILIKKQTFMIWTLSQMDLKVHLQGVLDLPLVKIWALHWTQENLVVGYDYISRSIVATSLSCWNLIILVSLSLLINRL